MPDQTREADAIVGFTKRLNRFRNELHGAVIEDCKEYSSDRKLRLKWESANAAELELSDYVRALLYPPAEAQEVERLRAALAAMLDLHGSPFREEYLTAEAHENAIAITQNARRALTATPQEDRNGR